MPDTSDDETDGERSPAANDDEPPESADSESNERNPDGGGRTPGVATDDDGKRRRWLLRAIVGITIGVPILVEAATLLGMLQGRLLGGSDGDGSPDDASTTATTVDGVGVGDELLPATPQRETLRQAYVRVVSEEWRFLTTVEIANTGEVPYELRLSGVTMGDGRAVRRTETTGRIPPGETAVLRAGWDLPVNQEPETLSVVGVTDGADEQRTVTREVPLGNVPIRWSSPEGD